MIAHTIYGSSRISYRGFQQLTHHRHQAQGERRNFFLGKGDRLQVASTKLRDALSTLGDHLSSRVFFHCRLSTDLREVSGGCGGKGANKRFSSGGLTACLHGRVNSISAELLPKVVDQVRE